MQQKTQGNVAGREGRGDGHQYKEKEEVRYTPEEFDALLSRFARGLPQQIKRAELLAAKKMREQIPGRVHAVGGTKDIKGNTRQYESASYKKRRAGQGLQTGVVDHTFTGNLQRSYKLFEVSKGIELRSEGTLNQKKIQGNERHYDNPVWEASASEEKAARKAFESEINKYIIKFFDIG